jgi:hypothetical protein
MSHSPAVHLDEQRVLRVLAEGLTLSEPEQAHVDACERCAANLRGLQADLAHLQARAREYTPAPARRFRLPAEVPERRWRAGGWRIALASAGAVLLATVIWWQTSIDRPRGAGEYAAISPEAFRADPVMAQARSLAENALPESYQAMAASLESTDDEGFIDFLIPPLEPEAKS